MEIGGKVFVVTGGGSGVGRELVLRLLARGAAVAAVDINPAGLEETARRAGAAESRLSTHIASVSDRASVEALPSAILARHGAIDGVVNNAGVIHPFLDLCDMDYDAIARVMEINFGGALYMTKTFLPHLLTRPEASITNISSMGALFAMPGQTIYGASKAGVKLLTEGLASELRGTRVRVMAVFPGGMDTGILENSGVSMSRRMVRLRRIFKLLTPERAARIIVRGIERNRRRLTIGVDSVLIDLCCRTSPDFASRLIYRIMRKIILE